MKAESANKLVKISSVIKEIYGDDLHKKDNNPLLLPPWDYYPVSHFFYIEWLKD